MRIFSSNIKEIEYDSKSRVLRVVFLSRPNFTYSYSEVPRRTWVGMLRANSKGEYFHKYIKDLYRYRKTRKTNGRNNKSV